MAQLSSSSVQILDGAVTLTKRQNSSAWQMRYKIGNRWIKATTKQKDLEKAKKIANDIYLRAKFREDEGLPIISKRFDAVARIVKNKLQAALDRRVSRILCKRRLITAEAFFPQTE